MCRGKGCQHKFTLPLIQECCTSSALYSRAHEPSWTKVQQKTTAQGRETPFKVWEVESENSITHLGGQAGRGVLGNEEKCYSTTAKHILLPLAHLHLKESWRVSKGREGSTTASVAPQFDSQGKQALILLHSFKKNHFIRL